MRPTDCPICKKRFLDDWLLQAEVRHHAVIYGERSAEVLVNERLEEQHVEEDHK